MTDHATLDGLKLVGEWVLAVAGIAWFGWWWERKGRDGE